MLLLKVVMQLSVHVCSNVHISVPFSICISPCAYISPMYIQPCISRRVYILACVCPGVYLFVSQCVCPTVSVPTSCIRPRVYPPVSFSMCICHRVYAHPCVSLHRIYVLNLCMSDRVYIPPYVCPIGCMSHRVCPIVCISHCWYIYRSMSMCPHVPAGVCSGVPPSACHYRAYVPPDVFRHGVYAPASQRMDAITTCMSPCVFIPQCVCPGVCMSHRVCLIVRMSIHTKYMSLAGVRPTVWYIQASQSVHVRTVYPSVYSSHSVYIPPCVSPLRVCIPT